MNNYTIWIHGRPSAGKTTIATELCKQVDNLILFDGDILRGILGNKLGYSRNDRIEQANRIIEYRHTPKNINKNIVICTNSHFDDNRKIFRDGLDNLLEVYVKCPLSICVKRDEKGLYKLALQGKIKYMPGINEEFEEPTKYDMVIHSNVIDIYKEVQEIIKCMKERYYM